jgi:hypothetical protein
VEKTYGWKADRKGTLRKVAKTKNRSFPGYEEEDGDDMGVEDVFTTHMQLTLL